MKYKNLYITAIISSVVCLFGCFEGGKPIPKYDSKHTIDPTSIESIEEKKPKKPKEPKETPNKNKGIDPTDI